MIRDFLISKYASFFEATDTNQDAYLTLNEAESIPFLYDITNFARDIFDEAREALGGPLYASSWFRCQALNQAVGGAATSKHTLGIAADVYQYGWTWDSTMVAAKKIHAHFVVKGIKADIIAEKREDGAVWIHIEQDNNGPRLFTGIDKIYKEITTEIDKEVA